jgi:hypothetical protein
MLQTRYLNVTGPYIYFVCQITLIKESSCQLEHRQTFEHRVLYGNAPTKKIDTNQDIKLMTHFELFEVPVSKARGTQNHFSHE